jgi:putative transcriptional regulator
MMEDMGVKQTEGRATSPSDPFSGIFTDDSPFRNKLLVAMPTLRESAFTKSVVYLCAHGEAGAMGIVINRPLEGIAFGELIGQLQLPCARVLREPVVHFGGPVETGRGFVLHSTDFMREDTVRIDGGVCITGTVDILKAIAEGEGPKQSIFALGYAGWGPGQLEAEMQANSWLTAPADDDLIFSADLTHKWEMAMGRMGVSPAFLSLESGHA